MKRGEDRIYSTALALNTLYYSWTYDYQIVPGIPMNVKQIMVKSAEWLIDHTLSGDYKPMNAFFSGTVKYSLVCS